MRFLVCASTTYEVNKVPSFLLAMVGKNSCHRFSKKEHSRLQFVVNADYNCCVHIENEKVHADDEDDKDQGGNSRVSLVHSVVRYLTHKHLKYCQEGVLEVVEAVSFFAERYEIDDDKHKVEKPADRGEGGDVC